MNWEDLIGKITCADCLDILKQLPDRCIDLVLTDPPYGIGYDKLASSKSGTYQGNGVAMRGTYRNTNWDNKTPDKEVFDEIIRVSKNAIIFGGNYVANMLENTRCWLVWDKQTGSNNWADCELAWTSFDKPVKKYEYLWNGMLQENMKEKEIRIHPTQKPVGLFMKILQDYSNENDLVLDCFSGSGTTAVACHNLKRRFICIERDREYAKASQERLEQEQKQQMLF